MKDSTNNLRAAIYARVSSEQQAEAGTIASQVGARGILACFNVPLAVLRGQAGAIENAKELLALSDTDLTELNSFPQLRTMIELVYGMIESGRYPS